MSEITNIYNSASGKTPLPTPGYSAVMFMFDDGLTSLYTQAFPIYVAAGAKFTGYIISSFLGGGGTITLAQAQEMYAAGMDMANHTDTATVLTTLSQAQQEATLTTCKNALDAGGMTRASAHVAYPNGAWDATTVAAMNAAGMLTGRGVQATFNTIGQIHDYSLLRQMRLILISSSVSLDYLKDVVDEAKTQNQIIAFLTHDISGAEITKQADIVNYVVSLGMPTITISEWYALYTAAYP